MIVEMQGSVEFSDVVATVSPLLLLPMVQPRCACMVLQQAVCDCARFVIVQCSIVSYRRCIRSSVGVSSTYHG